MLVAKSCVRALVGTSTPAKKSWLQRQCSVYRHSATNIRALSTPASDPVVDVPPTRTEKQVVVDLVKRFEYDAYLVGLCVPDHIRSAYFALHAFNIELALAQASARDSALPTQIRLQFWSDTLNGIFNGADFERTPVANALAFAASSNNLDKYWLDRMVNTRMADCLREDREWETLDDAETFAEGVYSSMMYATADLLQSCENTETAMSHLGIAHGLLQMLLAIPNAIPGGGYLGLPTNLFQQPLNPASNSAEKEDVVGVVHAVCVAVDEHLRAVHKLAPSMPKEVKCLLLQVRFDRSRDLSPLVSRRDHSAFCVYRLYPSGFFSGNSRKTTLIHFAT